MHGAWFSVQIAECMHGGGCRIRNAGYRVWNTLCSLYIACMLQEDARCNIPRHQKQAQESTPKATEQLA